MRAGSIPAWAGKPFREPGSSPLDGVYPRVGGETAVSSTVAPAATGLSPRGRGNQAGAPRLSQATGSIPAWAGKPSRSRLLITPTV